jgi:hypothetical protein
MPLYPWATRFPTLARSEAVMAFEGQNGPRSSLRHGYLVLSAHFSCGSHGLTGGL